MKPEGAKFSGLVDSVVNLSDGALVVAVGEEGDLRSFETFLAHLEPGLAEGVDFPIIDVGVGDIEGNEVDAGFAELGGMATQDEGISGVVIAQFGFGPMVEGSGRCHLGTRSCEDFGEVERPVGGVASQPEKVEDADGPVLFHGTGFGVERQAPAQVIGRGPGNLGAEGGLEKS